MSGVSGTSGGLGVSKVQSMRDARATVFWSYSHEDDELDGGRIRRLAERLVAEMSLLAVDAPHFFLDRESIEWGEEWQSVIDSALSDAPLLIAIVTPRYFTRKECRRELLAFHREAQGRDLSELVLPVIYAPVPDLSADHADEAVSLVARTQYQDWTTLRLSDENSVEYRSAINTLAGKLLELIALSTAKQLEREVEVASDEAAAEEDLASLIEKADDLWPEWLSVVLEDEVVDDQIRALSETFVGRRKRLRKSKAHASAIMATWMQEGALCLPLIQKVAEHAQIYSARTIELDPIVNACIFAGRDNPALQGILAELREKVHEAIRVIQQSEDRFRGHNAVRIDGYIATMPYPTRTWKEISRLYRSSESRVNEGNEIVKAWSDALNEILDAVSEATSAPVAPTSLDLN
jgi:TIR domain